MEGVFTTVKLVRKDKLNLEAFTDIAGTAKKAIDEASDKDVLAITITMDSPLKLVDAKKFDMATFDMILAEKM